MFNFSGVNQAERWPVASSLISVQPAPLLSEVQVEAGIAVDRSTPEVWQINTLSLNYPSLGLGLMMGSFSVLLTGLWLQVCRLSAKVQKRDRRIESLMAVDAITGLANRQKFCELGQRLLQTQRSAEIAVLVLNINQFTSVNDCFGHPAGDSLLCQVGDRLQGLICEQDILARTGDDEFAILISPSSCDRIEAIITATMSALQDPFTIRSAIQTSQRVYVRSRVGIAASNEKNSAQTFPQLLSQASIAMAQAKLETSRSKQQDVHHPLRWESRAVIFRPEMADQRRAHSQKQRSLRRAIERQELRVRYQPIVDLSTSTTVGFEALVRWQHPEEGLLCPSAFLPLAEEMGWTVSIDRWVLQQVCIQLQAWQQRGLYPYVSVNLSGPHLGRLDLADHVRHRLSQYKIAPSQLNMEITESVMIADPERAINTLRRLRRMGLRVSLDDFGTGYSSLGYLQQFPVDVLKIDRSFVQRLGNATSRKNQQDEFIVQSILSLAKGLNLCVVAEGIERDDQFSQLKQMQCSYGQGNFFSEPVQPLSADNFLIQSVRA